MNDACNISNSHKAERERHRHRHRQTARGSEKANEWELRKRKRTIDGRHTSIHMYRK